MSIDHSLRWVCATDILTHYDANAEYIQPEQRKPPRKTIGKLNTARHDLSIYQYDIKYEYNAPQYCNLLQYASMMLDNTSFFATPHSEHELSTPIPVAPPLYIDSSDSKQLLSPPKRLLHITPSKTARRVTYNIPDSHEDNAAAANENNNELNTSLVRRKSKLHAAKRISVKSKVFSNHNNKPGNITNHQSKSMNKGNNNKYELDDIFDDDIAKLLEAHNNAVVNHSNDSHTNTPHSSNSTPSTSLRATANNNSSSINQTVSAQSKQSNEVKTPPQPIKRIKATINFTAATGKSTNSSKPPAPVYKSNKSDTTITSTKSINHINKTKSTGNKPLIKVSRHLIGNPGADLFDDNEIAQLLITHNQSIHTR